MNNRRGIALKRSPNKFEIGHQACIKHITNKLSEFQLINPRAKSQEYVHAIRREILFQRTLRIKYERRYR